MNAEGIVTFEPITTRATWKRQITEYEQASLPLVLRVYNNSLSYTNLTIVKFIG